MEGKEGEKEGEEKARAIAGKDRLALKEKIRAASEYLVRKNAEAYRLLESR